MPPFPEIREQDATPEIAAIYSEIRTVSGLPLVNLIWRHIATYPSVLSWAWAAVLPVVTSARMDTARQRIVTSITLPPITHIGVKGWRSAGVTDQALARVSAVIDAYIHGNLTNIIALTALRLRLEHPNRPAAHLPISPRAAPTLVELDPLPGVAALDARLVTQIRALAKRHEGASDDLIPSLYLALSYWPGVIEALPTWLSSLYAPAPLRAARVNTCNLAEAEAETMLPKQSPQPEGIAAAQPALQRFTRFVIPALIPVCVAIRRLLPKTSEI